MNMEDTADRIDPLPAPTACVDGLQRHMQQYEQTISALQLENYELRTRLKQILQQFDLLQQQTGQSFTFYAGPQNGRAAQFQPGAQQGSSPLQAPATVVQPQNQVVQSVSNFSMRSRRILLHTRQILHISMFNQHLMTVSQDGTGRVFSQEGQSLFCFRADGPIRACLCEQKVLCWATRFRLSFHALDRIYKLEPYADVSDLLSTNLRDPAGYIFVQLAAAPTCLARCGQRIFVFGPGFVHLAEVSAQGFQILNSQDFLDEQSQPLYFAKACTCDGRVYVAQRERQGQGQNARFGARILEITDALQIRAFQLAQAPPKVDMLPIALLPFYHFVLLLCAGAGGKCAVLNVATQQFSDLPDILADLPTCAYIDNGRLFVGCTAGPRLVVNIFELNVQNDQLQLQRERQIALEDAEGMITSLFVKEQMMAVGCVGGELFVRGWQ